MKTFALLPVIGLIAASPSTAHVGDTVYPIYELPTSQLPDLYDGSLDDWEDAVPGATVDYRDFVTISGVGESAPVSADDLAYRFFLGWHGPTRRLYLAVERLDDVYVNQYDGEVGDMLRHDGGIELMVDGDHSGGPYQGLSDDSTRFKLSQAQQYIAIAESPDGQLLTVAFEPRLAWAARPPYAEAGGFTLEGIPSLTFIELYVTPFDDLNALSPDQSVPSKLAAGRIIGFQLSVPDFDTKPGEYRGYFTVAGQTGTWRDASLFADGLLLPCDVEDCGSAPPSAVAANSWGRIKAGFSR